MSHRRRIIFRQELRGRMCRMVMLPLPVHNAPMRAFGIGVLLLFISLMIYGLNQKYFFSPQVQTFCCDEADYRFLAEHAWGIPHNYSTYHPDFDSYWGDVLQHVAFRDIGVGTVYLFLQGTGLGSAFAVQVFLKLLLSAAYLFAFVRIRKEYGTAVAAACLCAMALLPGPWKYTEKLLAETFIRCLVVLSLTCLLPIIRHRYSERGLAAFVGCIFLLSHFKILWMLYGFWVLGALCLALYKQQKSTVVLMWLILGMLLIPVSHKTLHAARWENPALFQGGSLHLLGKRDGAFYRALCSQGSFGPLQEEFCSPASPSHFPWWEFLKAHSPSVHPGMFVRMLDSRARDFLLDHPSYAVNSAIGGLLNASNFPQDTMRPPVLFFIDVFCMLFLLYGAVKRRTFLISFWGLGLWVIPAVGSIISIYDVRYHLVSVGLPIVAVILVLAEERRQRV